MFLQIVGIIALCILGLALLLVGFVAWKWRSLRWLGSGSEGQPSELHLEVDPAPDWTSTPDASRMASRLGALGFERGPAYLVPEMPGVRLLSFVHAQEPILGVLYNHEVAGLFTDVCAFSRDGREFTVTSAPLGEGIDPRPETEKLYLKNAEPEALVAALREKVSGADLRALSLDDFVEEFESAYRRDMDWMVRKGGISAEEVRRVAAEGGTAADERTVEEATIAVNLEQLLRWEVECIENFKKVTQMNIAEWERLESSLIIFRDDFHPMAYVDYLTDHFDIDDMRFSELRAAPSLLPLRELLGTLARESGRGLRELGTVERPLAATIYAVT